MKLFNDNFEDVDDDDASKHDYKVDNFFHYATLFRVQEAADFRVE